MATSFGGLVFNIFIWFTLAVLAIQCWLCHKRRIMATSTTAEQPTASSTTSEQQQQAQGATVNTTSGIPSANTGTNQDAARLRPKVLRAIFPEQKVDSNATLVYDAESNAYQWTYNKSGDASCSICLENYEQGDLIVVSHCAHTYHRDCILGWLELKDECPNCRQRMWDTDTYTLFEEEIRRLESQPVSTS